jgi:hypothetical protein
MGKYRTVTVTVDADVYVEDVLDDLDDQDLIDTLESRGYTVSKEPQVEGFDREDWQFLLEMIDKQPEHWYTRRVRDKLMDARFCD